MGQRGSLGEEVDSLTQVWPWAGPVWGWGGPGQLL